MRKYWVCQKLDIVYNIMYRYWLYRIIIITNGTFCYLVIAVLCTGNIIIFFPRFYITILIYVLSYRGIKIKAIKFFFFFVSHFNRLFGFSGLGRRSRALIQHSERSTDLNANFHATKSRLARGNEFSS